MPTSDTASALRIIDTHDPDWFIKECANCITSEWVDVYDNWMKFVIALKNSLREKDWAAGRQLAIEITGRSPRFPPGTGGTEELWDSISPTKGIGAPSICYWAKQLNPVRFGALVAIQREESRRLLEAAW